MFVLMLRCLFRSNMPAAIVTGRSSIITVVAVKRTPEKELL
jgi:hypothetical protein